MSHLDQTYIPGNSVLNPENTLVPGDFEAPYTLISWLENMNILSTDSSAYFFTYTRYLNAWFDYNKFSKNSTTEYTRIIYINLLKEIALKYSTFDEKRFLSNLNFNDNQSLDVAIPFFSKKIKRICQYYAQNRDKVQTGVIRANLKGSNFGTETLIKKSIIEILENNEFEPTGINLPPLSSVINDLHVQIEEKFDTQQYYFDIVPDSSYVKYGITDPERQKFFSLDSVNVNDKGLYDLNAAIQDAIRAYPLFLNELGTTNFSINYFLSGVDYGFLSSRDFQLYTNDSIAEHTNVYNYGKYYEKNMGSDLYLLSGTADFNTLSSKILESANPYQNLLNRRYPTVSHISEETSAKREKYLGKFFTNNNLGISYWNTFKKEFTISNSLYSNQTIVIPDPEVGFDAIGLSLQEQSLSGIGYLRDVQWNRYDWSNDYAFGSIYSDPKKQKFYSYTNKSELDYNTDEGVSRISDYQDFWNEQLIWRNKDIFDFKNDDFYPVIDRSDYLLYNQGILIKHKTDIFGNHFGFFKNSSKRAYEQTSLSAYPSETIINNSSTEPLSSFYDTENYQKGTVFIRYYDDSNIVPLSAALSAVFIKYPENVRNEMQNSIINFDLIFNTIIIETPKYIIFDKLNFDFQTKIFDSNYVKTTYFTKYTSSSALENSSNFWYDEEYKNIIVSFLTLFNENSSSNNKILYPRIYAANIHDLDFDLLFPTVANYNTLSSFAFDLGLESFNAVACDKSLLNYNHESQVLGQIVKCYDKTGVSLLLNYKLIRSFNDIKLDNVIAFKPCGFIYDKNYSDITNDQTVRHTGLVTGIVGSQPYFSSFIASNISYAGYNYYYISTGSLSIAPNVSAFVFCDNTVSNTFNVSIDVYNLNLRDVYGTLVYDFSGPNEHYFTTINESITAQFGSLIFSLTYVASGQHVLKTELT